MRAPALDGLDDCIGDLVGSRGRQPPVAGGFLEDRAHEQGAQRTNRRRAGSPASLREFLPPKVPWSQALLWRTVHTAPGPPPTARMVAPERSI